MVAEATDEETEVCSAEKTSVPKLFCKLRIIDARCLENLSDASNKPSPAGKVAALGADG